MTDPIGIEEAKVVVNVGKYRLVKVLETMTAGEEAAKSLIWIGRFVVLISFVIGVLPVAGPWIAVAMLLVYPVLLGVFWKTISVRRFEIVAIAVIAIGLLAIWVRVGVLRISA